MKELSLNILDIVQNSVSAGATLIQIDISDDAENDRLSILITDNGHGMKEEFLRRVADPFVTTRTTRKVGMGIPLFKMAAEETGGSFSIQSKEGEGTRVEAIFVRSHIDRMPLGDMASTMLSLIGSGDGIDFVYNHSFGDNSFSFSTAEARAVLGDGVPLSSAEVLLFLGDYIRENLENLYGGVSV